MHVNLRKRCYVALRILCCHPQKPGVDVTGRLDFKKTLTENGILKEAETSLAPAIWLMYNDDFTIA